MSAALVGNGNTDLFGVEDPVLRAQKADLVVPVTVVADVVVIVVVVVGVDVVVVIIVTPADERCVPGPGCAMQVPEVQSEGGVRLVLGVRDGIVGRGGVSSESRRGS